MMGPGQTGKSTFAKMLMSILEKTSCTLELNRLSGRFETSRIMGKQLLVLGDVDPHGLTSKRSTSTRRPRLPWGLRSSLQQIPCMLATRLTAEAVSTR